jgi:DNA-binding XRE family transcriptional regulator
MSFYEDMEKSLLEAIEIEKGNIPVKERKGMPAKTYYIDDCDKELVDKLVEIRKKENISQKQLAELTGNKQQSISRTEKGEHSPSLKLFCNLLNAMGYELKIVKKNCKQKC